MLAKQQICFLGAGNMAEAIMVGLLEQQIPAKQIIASDPLAARLKQLEVNLQIRTCSSNKLAVAGADLVVLSVKPQVAMGVLQELGGSLPPDCLVLSIMAGVTTTTIEEALPAGTRVIRAMPNTPALVQQAATALCTGRAATPQDVNVAMELFNALGSVYQVSEGQMDIVTGLSGSGPAYVFSFIEALSDAGVKNGLERAGKIIMPIFFCILLLLAIFGLFSPGGMQAVQFLFTPDWSKLTPPVMLEAKVPAPELAVPEMVIEPELEALWLSRKMVLPSEAVSSIPSAVEFSLAVIPVFDETSLKALTAALRPEAVLPP